MSKSVKKDNIKKKNNQENKIRCFISINIPDEIAEKVKDIQDKLPEFRGKKTEKEKLHLTLKFLGEITEEEIEQIKSTLRGIEFSKFDMEAGELGVFSKKFIKIVWLHLTRAEELQKKIDKEVCENMKGFEKEKRFMSHLTIARVKSLGKMSKEDFLEKLNSIKIPEISFPVKEFCLMSSELKPSGAEHKVIERFSLIG